MHTLSKFLVLALCLGLALPAAARSGGSFGGRSGFSSARASSGMRASSFGGSRSSARSSSVRFSGSSSRVRSSPARYAHRSHSYSSASSFPSIIWIGGFGGGGSSAEQSQKKEQSTFAAAWRTQALSACSNPDKLVCELNAEPCMTLLQRYWVWRRIKESELGSLATKDWSKQETIDKAVSLNKLLEKAPQLPLWLVGSTYRSDDSADPCFL